MSRYQSGTPRPWLSPLTPLYALASHIRNRSFDLYPERSHRLDRPVISIGSLSSGGAGKTPFLIALAQLLMSRGLSVDVLSRGYGRRSSSVTRVKADGSADDFGDEPLLIAQSAGCAVYVGAHRAQAGRLAEKESPSNLHLLDDGFQHRQLARHVDIVLVTRQDLDDALLPAGNLRERLSSIGRAQIMVLRTEEAASIQEVLTRRLGALPSRIWLVERTLGLPQMPPSPMLFCGIARPHNLIQMLAQQGVVPVAIRLYRDHSLYGPSDMARLLQQAHAAGAKSFLTTEKDAVKISGKMRNLLMSLGPLVVAELRTRILAPETCISDLDAMLACPSGLRDE